MPHKLHRYYGAGYLHYITTSCFQRRPLLGYAPSRSRGCPHMVFFGPVDVVRLNFFGLWKKVVKRVGAGGMGYVVARKG